NKTIEDLYIVTKGIFTGKNDYFLKLWHEVNYHEINESWRLYSKGGKFRKWYGNVDYILKWKDEGSELYKFKGSGMGASKYFGKKTIVWTKISSSKIAFRENPAYVFFDDASPALINIK